MCVGGESESKWSFATRISVGGRNTNYYYEMYGKQCPLFCLSGWISECEVDEEEFLGPLGVVMANQIFSSRMLIREGCWQRERMKWRYIYTRREVDFMSVSYDFLSLTSSQKISWTQYLYLEHSDINSWNCWKIKWVYMKMHSKSKTPYKWKRFAKANGTSS